MKKKYIFIALVVLFFAFAALTFRPVIVPENVNECLVAEGKIINIFEGGVKDIVFKLEGDKTTYYINRGLEHGLNLADLRRQLIGNNVIIRYPKPWTSIGFNNSSMHLSVLEYNGNELYNEIELIYGKKE